MPTYQYRCKSCEHEFDIFQKFSDDPLTTCPECQGEIRRVFQPAGIIFKGSGWYIKDSKTGPGSTGAPAPAESSTSEASTKSAPAPEKAAASAAAD